MAPNAPLVAPILLPNGSIHFAAIKHEGTAQDVITALLETSEVKDEVLDDLAPGYVDAGGWGLQKVVKNEAGRAWEDTEIENLQSELGECHLVLHVYTSVVEHHAETLPSTTAIAPLLKASAPAAPSMHRHFSAFPLTSHMHTPTLRLVALHPALSLRVKFTRVPEISDDVSLPFYITRNSKAEDLQLIIMETLGLTKFLAGTAVPYVMEEVIQGKDGRESMHYHLLYHHSSH